LDHTYSARNKYDGRIKAIFFEQTHLLRDPKEGHVIAQTRVADHDFFQFLGGTARRLQDQWEYQYEAYKPSISAHVHSL
jgi:hypothetical protein